MTDITQGQSAFSEEHCSHVDQNSSNCTPPTNISNYTDCDRNGTSPAGTQEDSCNSTAVLEPVGETDPDQRRHSETVIGMKEHTHARLRQELQKAEHELQLKDEECKKLMYVHDQMSDELEELTAKLFEEANIMVQDANIKRMSSEKYLKEANSKIEVLEAEVDALKALVITSTPSMPNYHLHPQLEQKKNDASTVNNKTNLHPPPCTNNNKPGFVKGHRRSTSHHNFTQNIQATEICSTTVPPFVQQTDDREVDPVFFSEFTSWRNAKPHLLNMEEPFLHRIVQEDILTCLEFLNKQLSQRIYKGIINNTLSIDPVVEKHPFAGFCCLTETARVCKYRIRLSDSEPWYSICLTARNRLASVCDFITYIRYIIQGLVKSEDHDSYWEVMRLRRHMTLSRLGFMS